MTQQHDTPRQRAKRQFEELGLPVPPEYTDEAHNAPPVPGQATPTSFPLQPGWANPNRGESNTDRARRQFEGLGLPVPSEYQRKLVGDPPTPAAEVARMIEGEPDRPDWMPPIAPSLAGAEGDTERGQQRLAELGGKLTGDIRPEGPFGGALNALDLLQGGVEIPLSFGLQNAASALEFPISKLTGKPGRGFMSPAEALGRYLDQPAVDRALIETGVGAPAVAKSAGRFGGAKLAALLERLRGAKGVPLPAPPAVVAADGPSIAKQLGVRFDGVQEEIGMQFTDPVTGSTTYGNSVEELAAKLQDMRSAFTRAEQGASQSLRFRPPEPRTTGNVAVYPREAGRSMPTRGLTPAQSKTMDRRVRNDLFTGPAGFSDPAYVGRGPSGFDPREFNPGTLPPVMTPSLDDLDVIAAARAAHVAKLQGRPVMSTLDELPVGAPQYPPVGGGLGQPGLPEPGAAGFGGVAPMPGDAAFEDRFIDVARRARAGEMLPTEGIPTDLPTTPWRPFSEARGYSPDAMSDFSTFMATVDEGKRLGYSLDDLQSLEMFGRYPPIAGGMAGNEYVAPPSLRARLQDLISPPPTSPPPIPATSTTGLPASPLLIKMRAALKDITPVTRQNRALMKRQQGERTTAYDLAQMGPGTVEERHIAGRAAEAGPFKTALFEPVGPQFDATERIGLYDLVDAKPRMGSLEKARVKDTLHKILDLGTVPEPNELASFRRVFGSTIPLPVKGGITNEVLSTIKTLETSFLDISPFGRQGLLLVPGHPISALSSLKKGLHAAISTKAEGEYALAITNRPNYPLYVRDDLHITTPKAEISGRETDVAGNWLFETELPGIKQVGNVLALSKRFQYTFLNNLRADTFDSYVRFLNKPNDTKAMHDVAHMINAATGRGSLPKFLEDNPGIVNAGAYSLRYLVSRFETPWASAGLAARTPKASLMLIKDFIAAAAAVGGITALVARSGQATVNRDPESPDFGKTKVGNTRLDPYAGFQQDVRLLYRLGNNQLVKRKVGESDDSLTKRRGQERARLFGNFLRSKLGPGVSFIYDAWKGSDMVGNPVDVSNPTGAFKEALELVTPLNVADISEAAQDSGVKGALLATPSELGVGVSTYKEKVKQKKHMRGYQSY